jgi:hypothetical protein
MQLDATLNIAAMEVNSIASGVNGSERRPSACLFQAIPLRGPN